MIAAGIDSGSRATKAVLLDASALVVASAIVPTGSDAQAAADAALREALAAAGSAAREIGVLTATGYGRRSVRADAALTEITCHARGALRALPGARTVLDIGAQDSKFISIDADGDVADFVMNDRCAAGTGRFLEVASGILGVRVEDLWDLARRSAAPAAISSLCVVFTESEIVGLIAEGRAPADIAAGVLNAMAARMRGVMGHIIPREPAVFVGGVARNAAFGEALSRQIRLPFLVPESPQTNGALGAALFSLEKSGTSGIQCA